MPYLPYYLTASANSSAAAANAAAAAANVHRQKAKAPGCKEKVFRVKNCVLEKTTLKKDCRNCPITYPFGILTNNSMITHPR